jgi:hypothetical protein
LESKTTEFFFCCSLDRRWLTQISSVALDLELSHVVRSAMNGQLAAAVEAGSLAKVEY